MESTAVGLEVTWRRVLTVWWSFVWRSIVFGALAGAILGGIIGLIAGLLGQAQMAQKWGAIAGQIISIPVSMCVMKIILQKKWKEFSIQLIPRQD
ncbi:MAG: hypothetical protein NC819_03630 [Candidatus Omnitrophica bacterium]|nr:hypothetical protein [Candidatus Omnitrophota bacterium]